MCHNARVNGCRDTINVTQRTCQQLQRVSDTYNNNKKYIMVLLLVDCWHFIVTRHTNCCDTVIITGSLHAHQHALMPMTSGSVTWIEQLWIAASSFYSSGSGKMPVKGPVTRVVTHVLMHPQRVKIIFKNIREVIQNYKHLDLRTRLEQPCERSGEREAVCEQLCVSC